MLPIAIVAWRSGFRRGSLVAAGALGAWLLSNRLAGMTAPTFVWLFTATTQASAFAVVVYLVAVNDRHGHETGDRLLAAVARALQGAIRATDHVGRVGGDEFVVLLPETALRDGGQVLERVRAGVAQVMAEQCWPVTCSIGAVTFGSTPQGVDELLKAADELMYSVKQSGKNAVRLEQRGALPGALPG